MEVDSLAGELSSEFDFFEYRIKVKKSFSFIYYPQLFVSLGMYEVDN